MDNFMEQAGRTQLGAVDIESRQLSEIKGKIFMAKQFPRNEQEAIDRILRECESKRLAESAIYLFKRGESEVRGASIRLAEVVARHWGNIDCGVIEMERKDDESTAKAYAWDLESNYRDEKIFTVPHIRETKEFSKKLTDSRDIYEKIANDSARRKRACILAVIPGYVFDEAMEKCEDTLKKSALGDSTIEDRREKMFEMFKAVKEDITKEMLAEKVGKEGFDKISVQDIVRLSGLYNSIKDGFIKANDAFGAPAEPELPTPQEDDELKALNDMVMGDNNE